MPPGRMELLRFEGLTTSRSCDHSRQTGDLVDVSGQERCPSLIGTKEPAQGFVLRCSGFTRRKLEEERGIFLKSYLKPPESVMVGEVVRENEGHETGSQYAGTNYD